MLYLKTKQVQLQAQAKYKTQPFLQKNLNKLVLFTRNISK